jgi:FolB domain-containing protein
MSDRIHIRDLAVTCIVGIMPKERVEPQTILLNIAMAGDLAPAGRSDRLEDTIDYKVLKNRIVDALAGTGYFLIETLAERVARLCLEDRRVNAVTVCVDKPGALTGARSVAVEITRTRGRAARGP